MASSSSSSRGSRSMSTKKGEGKGKDTIFVKIVYLESDFVCSSPIIGDDQSGTLKAAVAHGVKEAAKELCLPKKLLHACLIGPLEKEDGSPFLVEEWVKRYFVVVEAKSAGGLVARCTTQETLIFQIVVQEIEDVSLSTIKVNLDNDLKQENDGLKEENVALKLRIFNLSEEQEFNLSKLKEERSRSLVKEALVDLKECASLKKQCADLQREYADSKRECTDLEKKCAELEKQCIVLKKEMGKLNGWERVLIRKMLDQCRKKCKEILVVSKIHVPDN